MNIPISAAKKISEQYKRGIVMIVGWDDVDGSVCITTYGQTKEKCQWAGQLADKFADFIDLRK